MTVETRITRAYKSLMMKNVSLHRKSIDYSWRYYQAITIFSHLTSGYFEPKAANKEKPLFDGQRLIIT